LLTTIVLLPSGWHGLVTAKTYVEVNPSAKVVVLEAAPTIGGVWAKHRLYPGLKSNNMVGTYEYSDFPMDESTFGVKSGEHIPGQVVHDYLHRYAEKFDIYRRIRFQSNVDTVERKQSGGWILTVTQGSDNAGDDKTHILAHKLIVATGLTSEPFLPDIAGSASFDAPLFHCRYLLDHADTLFKTATSVAVFGGTKSAWDAAYAFASAGITVDWIIRESGHGPVWMAPPYVTPMKIWLEKLVSTRFLTWFSPCVWGDWDGFGRIRRFFHGTTVGRKIVDGFWGVLANDVKELNGYDKHPETKKLKPWTSAFWVGSSLSILNYPTNFFDYVKNGTIKIHIADITRLSSKTVHLSTGESLKADALVCSTGWRHHPPVKFLPEGIDRELGLPYHAELPDDTLVTKADEEILNRFPRLKSQPEINPHYKPLESDKSKASLNRPYRLYRFMVPPAFIEDRSIAFNGMIQSINTATAAQTQALWLTAYLDGQLSLDQKTPEERRDSKLSLKDEVEWETILHSQFGKWRYPGGFGARYPDFVFDALPYMDMLLKDLGLQSHRKGGLFAECFRPYGPSDYRGLVDEWRIKVKPASVVPGIIVLT